MAKCILPEENPLIGISSWEKLAALPAVDVFGTDPYWIVFREPLDDNVRTTTRKIVDICGRRSASHPMSNGVRDTDDHPGKNRPRPFG